LIGTILNLALSESTIEAIETSQNIKAKLSTVQQKGKTATQFTTEVDNLPKLLEALEATITIITITAITVTKIMVRIIEALQLK